MYLSHLMIDVGANPDRPRPGRLWLRNIYHVHQRLCMAFPTSDRVESDPSFLKPYIPADFCEDGHRAEQAPVAVCADAPRPARIPRGPENGFLFRVDPIPGASVAIIVLSGARPNWGYAFQNAGMFLAGPPETREYSTSFPVGELLRFRIRINLSEKSSKFRTPTGKLDGQGRPRTQGKRVAVTWEKDQCPEDVIAPWFAEKGASRGFVVQNCTLAHLGWTAGFPPGKEPLRFRSALLEGTLSVEDPDVFALALVHGIGAAKAFGFGLLTVLPAARQV